MSRPKGRQPLTLEQIRRFAAELREVAAVCDHNCDFAEQKKMDTLNVAYYATGIDACEGISKFASAIYQAVTETRLQTALGVDPKAIEEVAKGQAKVKAKRKSSRQGRENGS